MTTVHVSMTFWLQALKYCLPEFQDDFEIVQQARNYGLVCREKGIGVAGLGHRLKRWKVGLQKSIVHVAVSS